MFWAVWLTAAQLSKTMPKAACITVLSSNLKAKPKRGPRLVPTLWAILPRGSTTTWAGKVPFPGMQGAKPREAASRWHLLQDIGTVGEIVITGLDSTLLSDGCIGPIWRDEGVVVAQPSVDREAWGRFPGVLNKEDSSIHRDGLPHPRFGGCPGQAHSRGTTIKDLL